MGGQEEMGGCLMRYVVTVDCFVTRAVSRYLRGAFWLSSMLL